LGRISVTSPPPPTVTLRRGRADGDRANLNAADDGRKPVHDAERERSYENGKTRLYVSLRMAIESSGYKVRVCERKTGARGQV
jgi:hypothetical protein